MSIGTTLPHVGVSVIVYVCELRYVFTCTVCVCMIQHLELNVVDAPDEAAAETVMIRYMEPADLGRRVDPKVPRYLIPSSGSECVFGWLV